MDQEIRSVSANGCFVCGSANPYGLHVQFRLEGDLCLAEFTPDARHAGYDDVTHGGIVYSLLDDVMANGIWLRGERAYTARADIRYRQPLPIDVAVRLQGEISRRRGRLTETVGYMWRVDDGSLIAQASAQFMAAV